MQKKFLAHPVVLLAFMSYPFSMPYARNALLFSQESSPPDQSYVQVTAVTVEPTILHTKQEPNAATVTVQILLRGEAPLNPKAIIEIGTSSTYPPNNVLKYENPTRTVSLVNGVTVVKFKAEVTPKTFVGKINIAVTIGGATKGISIKDSEPKDYIAELTISDR